MLKPALPRRPTPGGRRCCCRKADLLPGAVPESCCAFWVLHLPAAARAGCRPRAGQNLRQRSVVDAANAQCMPILTAIRLPAPDRPSGLAVPGPGFASGLWLVTARAQPAPARAERRWILFGVVRDLSSVRRPGRRPLANATIRRCQSAAGHRGSGYVAGPMLAAGCRTIWPSRYLSERRSRRPPGPCPLRRAPAPQAFRGSLAGGCRESKAWFILSSKVHSIHTDSFFSPRRAPAAWFLLCSFQHAHFPTRPCRRDGPCSVSNESSSILSALQGANWMLTQSVARPASLYTDRPTRFPGTLNLPCSITQPQDPSSRSPSAAKLV